jgi:cytochrome c-type biogenesis protein CcmH/NrfG
MPLPADSLIQKAIDQRKRKRYEEALVSALVAAEAEPRNANAWWQVSLNHWCMGDASNAAVALRRTVNLAPRFAEGWALLGRTLVKTGEQDEAKKAFEKAIEIDAENLKALEALSSIYASEDDKTQDDAELSILERIERLAGLSSLQLNRTGTLHYRNQNLFARTGT